MNNTLWSDVDRYFDETLGLTDDALANAVRTSQDAGLPDIRVEPSLGKLLEITARSIGARHILEIGTLGGVSTISLARGLAEGGKVVTLELEPRHAEVAARNLTHAGLAERVELLVGPALESLAKLDDRNEPPFDLTFIDADKENMAPYFDWAVTHTRPGGLVLADNVIRDGKVIEGEGGDARVRSIRAMLERIASDPDLDATVHQTVSSKGYDGYLTAIVRPDQTL